MHSRIEIVAQYRAGAALGTGRTVVTRILAGHHLAARETGPGVVHLIGTAAGPLGGDDVEIDVRIGPGARLALRSAGATIVQPGARTPHSRLRMHLAVEDGAELDVACEPTVVIRGAGHEGSTEVVLAGSGQVRLLEQVVLGRAAEVGGSWVGRTGLSRDGVTHLRHALRSSLLERDGSRVVSTLLASGVEAVAATRGQAVAMPLARGGMLVTATGREVLSTHADLLAAAEAARVTTAAA